VFVLNCPPYAPVCLAPGGGPGGEGTGRAAGFWRAIGITPPAGPDHLAALPGLYASLGEAAADARQASTADALTRARRALYREHPGPKPALRHACCERVPANPVMAVTQGL
jgi:Nitrate reductase delta subunit